MDITRSAWFRTVVALVSVFTSVELLTSAGIFGAGHDSLLNLTICVLTVLGLHRIVAAALGMAALALLPKKHLGSGSQGSG